MHVYFNVADIRLNMTQPVPRHEQLYGRNRDAGTASSCGAQHGLMLQRASFRAVSLYAARATRLIPSYKT